MVLLAAVLVPQTLVSGQTLLPGVRAPLLDTPATPSNWRSKLGQGSSTTGPSISDVEIQELARGLKYDPGLMYKFVHDHVHVTPMWGEVKGPYMTWMDRSGNDFDQATLMIALLKHAAQYGTGHTITNIKYVVGEAELTAEQFTSWFNVSDDDLVARQILARAGLYGVVTANGDYIADVHLEHVWVKATIDGQVYEFDPSFKSHTSAGRINNLQIAMGYDSETFIDDATAGATISDWTSVKDINKANIADDLKTYTTNLINAIKTDHHGDSLADLIGGSRIEPVTQTALPPVSLPYTVCSRDQEFALESIPSIYRTTLRVQHCGIDQTLYSSDIYGRRLSLKYNASNQPQLILDGTVKATGTTTTPGTSYDLTYTVDHPYQTTDFDGAVTLKITAGGFYHLLNGWGETGTKILLKHRDLLQQYRHDGYSDSSEEVLGESFSLVGLTWLAQTSAMRSMAAGMTSHTVLGHHLLGVAGQYGAPYIDVPLSHLGIVNEATYDSDIKGTFLAIAGHANAYEHEVIRQLQDCNAVSTVRLMEMANDRTTYDRIFATTSYNWAGTIQPQLQGYSQAEKDQVTPYVNAGYKVYLPEYGDLAQEDWTGTGFQPLLLGASMLTTGHLVSSGYKGGAACDNATLNPSKIVDYGFGATSGLDSEGAYTTGATDLTIGNGGLPFGLAFGRQYTSSRRLEDGPLGLGWSHNLDISALVRSDSFQILDNGGPMEAAIHIVTLYVTRDILSSMPDVLSRHVIASLCESWLMDQMIDNLVIMKQGDSRTTFVKRPDTGGKYLPPAGQNLRLITQGDGTFLVKNSQGIFYDFDSSGKLAERSDAFGNKVSFTYTSGRLSQVASKIGGSITSRTLSFTYTNNHITTVTDSASRSISYTYDAYGNLTSYSNPDANSTNYEYDATKHGLMTKVYSPVDHVHPFITIAYDTLNRMKQIVDANSCTWDFYRATYRTETLPPAQLDPNNQVKRYGTISWANPDNRTVTTTDALGRQTTSQFDGQLRPTSVTSPAGTSGAMSYDENNNLVQAQSLSIPESGDPNVLSQYGYCSYGNPDDTNRWFIHMKKQTAPTGSDTYFYYDYNEPSPPSYVGVLLRTKALPADPDTDANRPTVTSTYYPSGQLHTQTDPNGLVTHFEYYPYNQGAGLKKTILDPNGLSITTEVTYDSVGRVATAKDPRGNITTNQYSASGRLKKTTAPSPFNYEMTYEYYADGKVKYVKQNTPQGLVYLQALTYNSRGLKATSRGPYPANPTSEQLAVNYTQYTYDALGRLWKVTDAEDHVTTTRYCPDGKIWKVIDAEGHDTVTNTYNSNGSLQKVLDAKGNATQYEYNGFMGLKKTIYPDTTYEQPSYDLYRRLTQNLTRSDQKIQLTYDGFNRVKTKTTKKADDTIVNTITYQYDITGKLIRTVDNTGTVRNIFDKVGRLKRVEYPGSKTVKYEYDAAGNRTKLTYPDATYITYEYDELNRLTKIRNSAGTILAQYTYDALSRRTALGYANGTGADYSFDTANRLLYVDNQTTSGQHKYAYTYDNVGNRTTMLATDGSGTKTHGYSYDGIYQLTDVNYPTGYDYLATDTTFNYDAAGNRTTVVDGGGTTTYATNNLNQYTSTGGVANTYDLSGNMTYDGDGLMYTFDPENRLVTASKTTGPLAAACDNNLTFTTGGNAPWFATSGDSSAGGNSNAAQSGDISDSQTTWMQTTVIGKGTISYWRKFSCQEGDNLTFSIDGQVQGMRSGTGGWEQSSNTITTLGTHTLRWTYSKDASGSSGDDGAKIDCVQWTPSARTNSPALQDALDTGWQVVTDGNAQWSRTTSPYYYGGDSARSGTITANQKSQMEVLYEGTGTISFYWKVSSEENYDWLEFYLDGVRQDRISGEQDWQQKTYTITSSGTHSLLWQYVKDSSGDVGSDRGWVDYLQLPGTPPPVPNDLSDAVDIPLAFTTGGSTSYTKWVRSVGSSYYEGDCAQSNNVGDDEEVWMQTSVTVATQGTIKFNWKVSSQASCDYLEFYINGALQTGRISGEVDWQQKSYTITTPGTYTLKWRYAKDSSDASGSDCGWIDCVQWLGPLPTPGTFKTITYVYDTSGRRIEKKYDNITIARYLYDGDHCIAEYDNSHNLLRKYIFGPFVDEPALMIDVEHSNATYYYHLDGLGSVAALTNSSGATAVLYEYSVCGQAAVSDTSHPNRFMFTGREFDRDTGLYYYRARYYHPEIGRFLQTDPIGYGAGMNVYRYCGNNPIIFTDPLGLKRKVSVAFYDSSNPSYQEAADDFRFSFDMKGVTDPAEFIKKCLDSISSTVDIGDVYFYDDSHLNEAGTVLESLEFADAVFSADCRVFPYPGDGDTLVSPDLRDFFTKLGDILRERNGQDAATAAREGAIIHLRQDHAGNVNNHGGTPCSNLIAYSKVTGHRMTAPEGNLDFSWVDSDNVTHEEAHEVEGGPDYIIKRPTPPHAGSIYMTRLFTTETVSYWGQVIYWANPWPEEGRCY